MGPKQENLGRQKEAINECAAWRLDLFCCGRIKLLWEELRRSHSQTLGMACPPTQEEYDKLVQDAADEDNYRTTYARAVEPSMIAPITGGNRQFSVANTPNVSIMGTVKWLPSWRISSQIKCNGQCGNCLATSSI